MSVKKPTTAHSIAAIPADGIACAAAFAVALLSSLLLAAPTWAGTVFMKNGYIIQGPVIDQDDTKVVLGWENGKVFIYRRFLESVVLDAEEEANIAKKRSLAEQEAEAAAFDGPAFTGPAISVEQLPDWSEVVKEMHQPGVALGPHGFGQTGEGDAGTGDGQSSPIETPSDAVTDVRALAPRVELRALGISVEAPASWAIEEDERSVRWTGAAQDDGFLPALVITSAKVSDWDVEDAKRALREDPVTVLPDFQVLEEKESVIGGEKAYEVLGVGRPKAVATATEVKPVTVRQVLVSSADRFWLFSAFSSPATPRSEIQSIDAAIRSSTFLTAADADPEAGARRPGSQPDAGARDPGPAPQEPGSSRGAEDAKAGHSEAGSTIEGVNDGRDEPAGSPISERPSTPAVDRGLPSGTGLEDQWNVETDAADEPQASEDRDQGDAAPGVDAPANDAGSDASGSAPEAPEASGGVSDVISEDASDQAAGENASDRPVEGEMPSE